MCIDQITKRCSSVISIHDAIIVHSKTDEEHYAIRLNIMIVVQENDLVFNSCIHDIRRPDVSFCRHHFTGRA